MRVKSLADGSVAVGTVNMRTTGATVYTAKLASHGVLMLRVSDGR